MSEGVWENRGPWRRVNSLLHLGVVVQGTGLGLSVGGLEYVMRKERDGKFFMGRMT